MGRPSPVVSQMAPRRSGHYFVVPDDSGVNSSLLGAAPGGNPFIIGAAPMAGSESLMAGILSGTNPTGNLGDSGGIPRARPVRRLAQPRAISGRSAGRVRRSR